MIYKQRYGSDNNWALGGTIKDIEPLHWSCYNYGGCDSNELLDLGGDFYYFIISEDRYIKCRTISWCFNWPFNHKGHDKGAYPFAKLRSIKEWNYYPEQRFIPYTFEDNKSYTFGNMPIDLFALSEDIIYDFNKIEPKIEEIVKEDSKNP